MQMNLMVLGDPFDVGSSASRSNSPREALKPPVIQGESKKANNTRNSNGKKLVKVVKMRRN